MQHEFKHLCLIEEPEIGKDHWVLGASPVQRPIIFPDGHGWGQFKPETEYQSKRGVETNSCVSFSCDNGYEYYGNYLMSIDEEFKAIAINLGLVKNGKFNLSDRRTAKGSGTDPNAGNTVTAVVEYLRTKLFCPEDLWPFPDGMTKEEYFKDMPDEVENYGKKVDPLIEVQHEWVPRSQKYPVPVYSDPEQLIEGLKRSVLRVSVDPRYVRNDSGLIYAESPSYGHSVTLYDYVLDEKWLVHDHYLDQFIEFAWDYKFGHAKALFLKKKIMPKLYKTLDSPAIYFFNPEDKLLVPFSDGEVKGGSLFKIFFGDYKNVPVNKVQTLPYPVAPYSITTK